MLKDCPVARVPESQLSDEAAPDVLVWGVGPSKRHTTVPPTGISTVAGENEKSRTVTVTVLA
ncbi:hypothetical protein D3C87_1704510 [compost metagenome]